MQGALIERCVAYALRVEFNENLTQLGDPSTCQLQNTIGGLFPKTPGLREFNYSNKHTRRLGYVNASLLMNKTSTSGDIVARQLANSHTHMYNSCIIVHDQFLPIEIYKIISFCIQPAAPIVVFSCSLEPLIDL